MTKNRIAFPLLHLPPGLGKSFPPDIGTTMFILSLAVVIMVAGKVKWLHIIILALMLIIPAGVFGVTG